MALLAMFVFNAVFAQEQEEKPILTFGCLSDLHSQQTLISGDVESVRLRGTITKTLNAMKAEENLDLIVLGGDYLSDVTISYENYLRTRELLVEATRGAFPEGAKTPVIYVNGNHEYEVANFDNVPKGYNAGDYYDIPMKTDIGALADEDCFYEMASNGSSDPVKLLAAYHYVIKGFDFVVLNTGKNFFQYAWNYTYSDESIEWVGNKLEEIYAESPNKTVFFLVHLPFGDSNSISSASKGMTEDCASLLKPILAKYPNLIMLYGHDHGKDTAYIREKTEQRVTVYDSYGNKWVDPNAVVPVTEFCVRNAASGMYLDYDPASNLTTNDSKAVAEILPSSLVANTYSISYPDGAGGRRYTQSGSNGRFSGNAAHSANSSLYVYKVEDSGALQGKATRVESIESGEAYLLVSLSTKGGYWMLTNKPYSSGTGLRLDGVKVSDEVPGDEITFTQDADYSPVWIIEEPVSGEQEDLPVYYIQNYNTSKFLGHNSVNLATTDKQKSDVTITPSSVTDGALNFYLTGFVEAYSGPYLYCGSNGRFSGNKQKDNASSQILAFEVEDPTVATITAKQVTAVTAGKTYLLVGVKNGAYYALTDEMYMEGDAAGQRMVGAPVTITDGTITFTQGTSSVLWTIGEKEIVPVEPGAKSFFSAFMGSMRYYSNSIETGGSTVNDSRIIQAMIVSVYPDRVELKMKNYGESGTINGITVNKDLEPYVSYREVTHSAEAVTLAPAFEAETLKEEVTLGEAVKVGVAAPGWYNVYYTLDGTEPTMASASVKDGVIEWTPEAEGEYTVRIAAQEGIRLLSESVAYTFNVKKDTGAEAMEPSEGKVYASAAGIAVRNYAGRVKVHNVVGQQSVEMLVDGNKDIIVDKGIYIVALDAKAFKVIVK